MNGQKENDRKAAAEKLSEEEKRKKRKMLILGGICCGLALCAASCFQQFGIQYTTVGKAGFITAFYIIIVPVISLFFGKKCGPLVWAGVLFALSGLDVYKRQVQYEDLYPGYEFASNKGYGSARHIAALKEIGPCPIHRRSFIKNFAGDAEK